MPKTVPFLSSIRLAIMILFGFQLFLSACSFPQISQGNTTPYRPPTQPAPLTPLVLISPTPEQTSIPGPMATPACQNSLTYLDDLSIPDGTLVTPGETFDKRWLVRNSGNCNWDHQYQVRLIAGMELGLPAQQSLFPARGGTEFTIRMLLTAPTEPGTYRSAWQAYDPQGNAFGDPFYVDFIVSEVTGNE